MDEFLAAVDALTVAGGTENLYHALFGVLADAAPDYTDIIVFTDEYSDDEDELFDTVLSMAQEKNCAITIIFTEDVYAG